MPLPATRNILILEIDLIIQERRDQARRSATSPALLPLIRPNRIIAIQRPFPLLVQPTQDSIRIVRKKALRVEYGRKPLRARIHRHVLAVLVLVHADDCIETLFERVAVCREANNREHNAGAFAGFFVPAYSEDLGRVPRVDAVARAHACVAGQDAEVFAGDAEG